jgi:two-component system, OmpR family, response regulator
VALSIFIIDDNEILLQAIKEAVEECAPVEWLGHAGSAPQAIEWLRTHRTGWRLLLVDLFLTRGSGLDVVAECGGRAPEQRVVVLTNYATSEIRRRALELGADAVFDKSTEIEELLAFCVELGGA